MRIRCTNGDSDELTYRHTEETWGELLKNSKSLSFECCDAEVVLKSSKLGERYFAHKSRGRCTSAPETSERLRIKTALCVALEEAGWHAHPEKRLMDKGELCIADVYGVKDECSKDGVIFEVQSSPQKMIASTKKAEGHHSQNLQRIWLMQHYGLPVTREAPAVRIQAEGEHFGVYLPKPFLARCMSVVSTRTKSDPEQWQRCGTIGEFVRDLTNGKVKFSGDCTVEIQAKYGNYRCLRCNKAQLAFMGVNLENADERLDASNKFINLGQMASCFDNPIIKSILKHANSFLSSNDSGLLSVLYTAKNSTPFINNSCIECGTVFESFYLLKRGPYGDMTSRVPLQQTLSDFDAFHMYYFWYVEGRF